MVQLASYLRRVLCKTRLIFPRINGPIVTTEINMSPNVVIVTVEKLARLVQLQLSRQQHNKIAKKITGKFAKFNAGP